MPSLSVCFQFAPEWVGFIILLLCKSPLNFSCFLLFLMLTFVFHCFMLFTLCLQLPIFLTFLFACFCYSFAQELLVGFHYIWLRITLFFSSVLELHCFFPLFYLLVLFLMFIKALVVAAGLFASSWYVSSWLSVLPLPTSSISSLLLSCSAVTEPSQNESQIQ